MPDNAMNDAQELILQYFLCWAWLSATAGLGHQGNLKLFIRTDSVKNSF